MKFTYSVEYAVHALVSVAAAPEGSTVLLGRISSQTRIPEPYLRKVLQVLARRGLVVSRRGAHGGYWLARDAGLITLKDVVEAIDGALPTYTCLKILRGCRLEAACPVQRAFTQARERMGEVLEAISIEDLLAEIRDHQSVANWLDVIR